MKVLVLSDSHLHDISKIKKEDYDLIIHAGDYGVSKKYLEKLEAKYVKGNCDFDNVEDELIFDIEDKVVFLCHGDKYNVKYCSPHL